jgi:hypothetical protein
MGNLLEISKKEKPKQYPLKLAKTLSTLSVQRIEILRAAFQLEELGFTNPNKVRLMLCIVIACYILCVCEGIKKMKKKAKKIKKMRKKIESQPFIVGMKLLILKFKKMYYS